MNEITNNFHTLNKNLQFQGLVVATLTQPADLEHLTQKETLELEADMAEIRLDSMANLKQAVASVGLDANLPLLFTARHPDEGGEGGASHSERRDALDAVAARAGLIDIELQSLALEPFQGAVDSFRSAECGVVISHHDFKKTPESGELREIAQRAEQAGADIVKIASRTDDWASLANLAELLVNPPVECKVSVMGMGKLGKASRLLFAQIGSALNYGYYRVPNADGQWQAKTFRDLLRNDIGQQVAD